jgi:hypothetical protein
MVNCIVFNPAAERLKAAAYGWDGSDYKAVAVDSNGRLQLSPQNPIAVTATDFDIRSLNSSTDSVLVTALDLDIRNLSGTQDSVQLQSCGFVEDNISVTVLSGTTFLLTKNISGYRQNSYFIRNTGGATVTVTLQLAPIDDTNYYINHSTPQGVGVSSNSLNAATTVMKYARLRVVASANTRIVVYYNGRA